MWHSEIRSVLRHDMKRAWWASVRLQCVSPRIYSLRGRFHRLTSQHQTDKVIRRAVIYLRHLQDKLENGIPTWWHSLGLGGEYECFREVSGGLNNHHVSDGASTSTKKLGSWMVLQVPELPAITCSSHKPYTNDSFLAMSCNSCLAMHCISLQCLITYFKSNYCSGLKSSLQSTTFHYNSLLLL